MPASHARPKRLLPAQRRVSDFVGKWQTKANLARLLSKASGEQVSYWTVAAWVNRGYIPSHWIDHLEKCARQSGVAGVTRRMIEALTVKPRTQNTAHRSTRDAA